MVKRKYIHILDVLSILLFSLLANYIFDLKINFKAKIDYIALFKLVALSVSTFVFYFAIDMLKKFAVSANDEFNAETTIAAKATNSIDNRYMTFYKQEKVKINLLLVITVISGCLFFLIEPILALF